MVNKWGVSAVAVVVIAAAALLLSSGRLNPAGRSVDVGILGDVYVRIVSCGTGDVWLSGRPRPDVRKVAAKGYDEVVAALESAVARVTPDGSVERAPIGRGLIVSFDEAERGAVRTVLLQDAETAEQRSRTFLSTDRGRTWSERPSPVDTIGVAFDEGGGFAWSTTRIYRTDDEGRSWRSVDVAPFELQRGTGPGGPVLGPDGRLWVPANARQGSPRAVLLLVDRELSVVRAASWNEDSLKGVGPDGSGGALVVLKPLAAPGFRVARVPFGTGTVTDVFSERKASAAKFTSFGRVAMAEVVSWNPKANPLSAPPHAVAVTTDGGKTWATRDVAADAADSVCFTEQGVWTLSSYRKRLVYRSLVRP